jgi:hypothetical protein
MLLPMEAKQSLVPTNRRLNRVQIAPSALSLDAASLDTIVADLRANGGCAGLLEPYRYGDFEPRFPD